MFLTRPFKLTKAQQVHYYHIWYHYRVKDRIYKNMFIQENDRSKDKKVETFDNIDVKHRHVIEVVLNLFLAWPRPHNYTEVSTNYRGSNS